MIRITTFLYCFLFINIVVSSQTIDQVVAVVGDEIVLYSDIESQIIQYKSQGNYSSEMKCVVIEDLLKQSILIHYAKLDSIEVTKDEIDSEVEKRYKYFEDQLGSQLKVESYFDKSIIEIKSELSNVIENQMFVQRMQNKIVSDIKLTPAEVQKIFDQLNSDDIPIIPEQVEISQIVVTPEISEEQTQSIKDKLNLYRERVYAGEDFKTLAILYSDDIVSAKNGGELGYVNRGELVPEFERAAFKLKEGEVSEIVVTKFGMHIIQLIDRKGEQINVRHILVKPKPNSYSKQQANEKINEIFNKINLNEITFNEAVKLYSDHPSKNNKGLVTNPMDMSTLLVSNDLPPLLKSKLSRVSKGDILNVGYIDGIENDFAYRIFKINNKIDEHKATFENDFTTINNIATTFKSDQIIEEWIQDQKSKTFIKIDDNLINCSFKNYWTKK
jgi:peptidyl-prolyl cis-trans isomerase SurA